MDPPTSPLSLSCENNHHYGDLMTTPTKIMMKNSKNNIDNNNKNVKSGHRKWV